MTWMDDDGLTHRWLFSLFYLFTYMYIGKFSAFYFFRKSYNPTLSCWLVALG